MNPPTGDNVVLNVATGPLIAAQVESVARDAVRARRVVGRRAGVHSSGVLVLIRLSLAHPVDVIGAFLVWKIENIRTHPGLDGQDAG
jgi:hypothetical protein